MRVRNATIRCPIMARVRPANVFASSALVLVLIVRTGCAYVLLFFTCILYASHRHFMQEGNGVQEIREKIKTFLAQNRMIKGDPGTANLHSVGHSTSSQGVFTGATPPAPGPNGLTHASAMPVVTPDGRSSSPSTPPNSRDHHTPVAGDRPSHRNGQDGVIKNSLTNIPARIAQAREEARVFTTHALLHWVDR